MACRTTADPHLCLASASPRRAELLTQIGVRFTCVIPGIDEGAIGGADARDRVLNVARAKSRAVAPPTALPVLAADTAVVSDGEALGKPVDRDDAMRMLARLSNRSHWVYTAVVVRAGERYFEAVGATEVWFAAIPAAAMTRYCDGEEPYDKAGAYGIQGRGALFVRRIEGSYSNVVGLPLFETAALLRQAGISL